MCGEGGGAREAEGRRGRMTAWSEGTPRTGMAEGLRKAGRDEAREMRET